MGIFLDQNFARKLPCLSLLVHLFVGLPLVIVGFVLFGEITVGGLVWRVVCGVAGFVAINVGGAFLMWVLTGGFDL